jgi:hypothetical protein
LKKGQAHNYGPCERCGGDRAWFKSELCTACRKADKAAKAAASKAANRERLIQLNKDRHGEWHDIERTRAKAWSDLSTTAPADEVVPQYGFGAVTFWARWYYKWHDEEALVAWEEKLGISHDAYEGWDSRYGVGTRPQYVRKNTVL